MSNLKYGSNHLKERGMLVDPLHKYKNYVKSVECIYGKRWDKQNLQLFELWHYNKPQDVTQQQ